MSVIVDTSVILAALSRRERRHSWARRTLVKILSGGYGPAYVTDYIVAEALNYAAARLGEEDARRLLSLLVHRRVFRIIPVTIDVFNAAAEIYEENLARRISFTDAATVAAARLYSIDLVATLDEALAGLHPSISPGGGG